MSSSSSYRRGGFAAERLFTSLTSYAMQSPVKFVALATLALTGAVPVGVFLLYAAGTVVGTAIAALVLDLALLTFGVFGLAVGLCFAACISCGVAGVFSAAYFGYRAAVGSLKRARTRLSPSTVAASSSSGTTSEEGETFDKEKHHAKQVAQDLLTSLLAFLDTLTSLTGSATYTNTRDQPTNEREITDYERNSDLCRTSLTVCVLAAAIFCMSYGVLVAAYMVVHFT